MSLSFITNSLSGLLLPALPTHNILPSATDGHGFLFRVGFRFWQAAVTPGTRFAKFPEVRCPMVEPDFYTRLCLRSCSIDQL